MQKTRIWMTSLNGQETRRKLLACSGARTRHQVLRKMLVDNSSSDHRLWLCLRRTSTGFQKNRSQAPLYLWPPLLRRTPFSAQSTQQA